MRIKYFHHGVWPSASPSTSFVTYNCLGFTQQRADFELVTVADSPRSVTEVLASDFGIDQPLPVRLLNLGPFRRHHRVVHLVAFWHFLFARWDVLITRNLGFLPWAVLLRRLRGGHRHLRVPRLLLRPGIARHPRGTDDPQAGAPGATLDPADGRRDLRLGATASVLPPVLPAASGSSPRWRASGRGLARGRRGPAPGTLAGYLGTFDPTLYDFDLVFAALGMVTVPGARLVMAGGRGAADIDAMRERAGRARRGGPGRRAALAVGPRARLADGSASTSAWRRSPSRAATGSARRSRCSNTCRPASRSSAATCPASVTCWATAPAASWPTRRPPPGPPRSHASWPTPRSRPRSRPGLPGACRRAVAGPGAPPASSRSSDELVSGREPGASLASRSP